MKNNVPTVRKEWGLPKLTLIDVADINAKNQMGHVEADFAKITQTAGGAYKFFTPGNPVAVGTQNYNFVS